VTGRGTESIMTSATLYKLANIGNRPQPLKVGDILRLGNYYVKIVAVRGDRVAVQKLERRSRE
jgi:hypothetical protein